MNAQACMLHTFNLQEGLGTCPSCVPEKVGINQIAVHKKLYAHKKIKINANKPVTGC